VVWVWQLQTKKTEQLLGHEGAVMSVTGDAAMHCLVSGGLVRASRLLRDVAHSRSMNRTNRL
jgi:hypothetical protein